MTMNTAHFPHQGAIKHPTIDDYRTELALAEDAARRMTGNRNELVRWRRLIRKLQWAADARPSPSRSERSEAA